MTLDLRDRLLGGLYGALIGDAVGTSYEFKKPEHIPDFDLIEMIPPEGFKKSWSGYPYGIWSDDGSQQLCLLEYYTEQKPGDVWYSKWAEKLVQWDSGHLWWNGDSFDSGIQTMEAIQAIKWGKNPLEAATNAFHRNGNGSLMRCLPTALWQHKQMEYNDLVNESINISRITHPHNYSTYLCAAYNIVADQLLLGADFFSSIDVAFHLMGQRAADGVLDGGDLSCVQHYQKELQGSGFVVDCFWTAEASVRTSTTYEETIKKAIAFGHDTDTTAIVAGGWAGILHGYSGIPQRWIDQLKGKELVEPLAQKLLEHHGLS